MNMEATYRSTGLAMILWGGCVFRIVEEPWRSDNSGSFPRRFQLETIVSVGMGWHGVHPDPRGYPEGMDRDIQVESCCSCQTRMHDTGNAGDRSPSDSGAA